MDFAAVADTSAALAATRSRTGKTRLVADLLGRAGPDEQALVALYAAGQTRQGRLDVGWSAVGAVDVEAADKVSLTVADVDAALGRLAGAAGEGSRGQRERILTDLLGRATPVEQRMLRGLLLGELRQGALEGVVVQGVAAAAEVPVTLVRRALMLSGDLGATAVTALQDGRAGLEAVRLEVFRPVQPMLAATAADVAAAVADLGRMAVDAKLDGARIQVHRRGDEIATYTRNLRRVDRPDVAAVVATLPVNEVILDGEVVGIDAQGRPHPFQDTMASFGSDSGHAPDAPAGTVLTPFFFDCLRVDGRDLLDEPLTLRHDELRRIVDPAHLVARTVTADADAAQGFFDRVLADGHEGVVCKDLDAPYAAGRRGSAWRKVKPVHTLDLVVLAAEWGSGRRRGWLSNLHLGARDPAGRYGDPGGFVMLGKTFKGLTDELLVWQTSRLLELETGREGHIVHVRPALVVEIALDGLLRSTRYPAGLALRFARVRRYRDDKDADAADTIADVEAVHGSPRGG